MGDTFGKLEESIFGLCGGVFGEKGGVERAVGAHSSDSDHRFHGLPITSRSEATRVSHYGVK